MNKPITLLLAALLGASAQAQDVAAGEKKAAMCIGCHNIVGYQASFPEVYKVPMIAGQGAKYIVSALGAYKKGDRKHPTMRAVATSLSDADMADIAAWYQQQGSKAAAPATATPPADVAALFAKGACVSCHGANFNTPIDPTYPKLAGQHPDYLFNALRAYATDGKAHLGRANAIMKAQVQPFKRNELKAMAQYLGTLPTELQTVQQPKFR